MCLSCCIRGVDKCGGFMAGLEMFGPYLLEEDVIKDIIKSGRAGNYALGYTTENYYFLPKYIGRADQCVQEILLNQVAQHPFKMFKFSYAHSAEEAFIKECHNYHQYEEQIENESHPETPALLDLACPCCDVNRKQRAVLLIIFLYFNSKQNVFSKKDGLNKNIL